jgi:hypothetical protein
MYWAGRSRGRMWIRSIVSNTLEDLVPVHMHFGLEELGG